MDNKKLFPLEISKRTYFLLSLLVVVLAAYLRLSDLNEESLFMDEIYQVTSYGMPWLEMVNGAARQQQPPLDYYLGHLVYLFSISDFAVRLPAALFGISSIVLVLTLLWNRTTPSIAIFCSLLYTFSPFHIHYSQEARPYSIAIFFFLLLVQTIIWLEGQSKHTLLHLLILSLVEFLFLLSRLLSPLCVFLVLNLLFFLRASIALHKKNKQSLNKNRLYLIAALLASALYLPFFIKLFGSAQRYINNDTSTGLLQNGMTNFTLEQGFRAFITQFEPFGWLALGFSLFSLIILGISWKKKNTLTLFSLSGYLLVASLCLHLFIFLAKTTFPFRPSYAIYLQPAAILLIGYAILQIYKFIRQPMLLILLGTIILSVQVNAAIISKAATLRTDWKQLASHINTHLGRDYFVIFDSLSIRKSWKPYSFGNNRYAMISPSTTMPFLQKNTGALKDLQLHPVLVYFYYRDYMLLPTSSYAIHPNGGGVKELSEENLKIGQKVKVTFFTGLLLFELKNYTGDTIQDTYTLTKEAVKCLPVNNTLVDTLLLSSRIEQLYPNTIDPSYNPLKQAKELAKKDDWPVIEKISSLH